MVKHSDISWFSDWVGLQRRLERMLHSVCSQTAIQGIKSIATIRRFASGVSFSGSHLWPTLILPYILHRTLSALVSFLSQKCCCCFHWTIQFFLRQPKTEISVLKTAEISELMRCYLKEIITMLSSWSRFSSAWILSPTSQPSPHATLLASLLSRSSCELALYHTAYVQLHFFPSVFCPRSITARLMFGIASIFYADFVHKVWLAVTPWLKTSEPQQRRRF